MSANWFAGKLGPGPALPPQVPTQAPPYNPVPQQPQPQQMPEEQPQRLPQSAIAASRCPGCGSGNYGQVTAETKARCYDCGYPVVQAGSGVSAIGNSATGPTQAARQSTTSNNWNPQGIIGHI